MIISSDCFSQNPGSKDHCENWIFGPLARMLPGHSDLIKTSNVRSKHNDAMHQLWTMHSLYPQMYQPPASNLSFNVEIRKVAIRAFSSAGCCSENHLTKERFDWTPRNTSNIINGVRSEDSGKIQAHALSWTVPERREPGAVRLAVTRQIMSNAMLFSSFLMCIYAICFDFRFWWWHETEVILRCESKKETLCTMDIQNLWPNMVESKYKLCWCSSPACGKASVSWQQLIPIQKQIQF